MNQTYKISKYESFYLKSRECEVYLIHIEDNNCEDIKVGDTIILDGKKHIITMIEHFQKSFGIKGDNIAVITK